MNYFVFSLVILLFLFSPTFGASCQSPRHSSSGYSTQDGFFHFKTTYIMEFALQCANNYEHNSPFFAIVNGRVYQLSVSEETTKYQVSWLLEHPESSAQTFDVVVLDEDKLAEYKKAVQSGDENPLSRIEPLFTTQYYHPGVSKKAPFSSEGVCLLIAAAAVYFALNFKQELAKRD
uniref:Translocon-associated protein subunit delta n=1 Tax=Meloidogyne javanica TaxID=6303 RepID=A0A915LLX1_MELJA